MTAPADVFAAAIREAVHAFKPDATVVLSGTLIIEALHADEPDPVLNVLDVGDLSPWVRIGMLRTALLGAEHDALASFEDDD